MGKLPDTRWGPAEDRYANGLFAGGVDRFRGCQSQHTHIVGEGEGASGETIEDIEAVVTSA